MTEDMDAAVEKLRAAFDAVNRGDLDSAVQSIDENLEIGHTPFIDPPEQGREGFLEFLQPDLFERQRIEVLATEARGNVILCDLVYHVVGKGSGVEVSQANFQLFTFRDGMVVKWEVFFDRAEAEAAVAPI